MQKISAAPLLCVSFGLMATASAADTIHGKELHDIHCTSCHIEMTGGNGSTLYTRADRKVKSMAALEAQVRNCASNSNLLWFDEDIGDVAAYLNAGFYKFHAP